MLLSYHKTIEFRFLEFFSQPCIYTVEKLHGLASRKRMNDNYLFQQGSNPFTNENLPSGQQTVKECNDL